MTGEFTDWSFESFQSFQSPWKFGCRLNKCVSFILEGKKKDCICLGGQGSETVGIQVWKRISGFQRGGGSPSGIIETFIGFAGYLQNTACMYRWCVTGERSGQACWWTGVCNIHTMDLFKNALVIRAPGNKHGSYYSGCHTIRHLKEWISMSVPIHVEVDNGKDWISGHS